MKAILTTGTGPLGVQLADVPEPELTAGQALIEVRAAGVNRGDLAMAGALPAGSRLGSDVAGRVVQTAADGSGPAEGTTVFGLANRDGWAERVAVATDRLAPVSDRVADVAAALPLAGLTALYALRAAQSVLGRSVLLTGASGGVGRLLVQLASASGATVFALAGSAARTAGLRELGADHVATYDDAGAEPVDVVIDSVGGAVLTAAFQRLLPGGTLVSYGNTVRTELVLPVDWGYARPGVRIKHLYLFAELTRQPAVRDLTFLARLLGEHALDPQVARTVSFADLAVALTALRDRQVNGKVLLTF